MAVKKTELYSSLWASCDALRGGMDASQYKDYILTLLFMKYVTDKYKGQKYGDLIVFDKANDPNPDPEKRTGCSFDDFIALKNKKNIGEGIDKIIARLAEVNEGLKGVIDIAHFNDETKIGKNKEMVDKLTKLISIFQRPELDFSKNKAEGDDIIGDAYEYLMRNFASESGKSKGQFYTPAEVSRILAKIIGIDKCSDHDATVCDPACGSGSLLIRALEEAPFEISGYGQEKDSSTAGLAKMNAVLHNKATIKIMAGNTFSDPQFKKAEDASELERFDYIVANPPFSLKNWADGLKEFGRFSGYGDRPPEKNGDYAWLMHILKTLKSTGKAAVILPHGVLFRGNAEATIRQKIIDKGWIKGIISLPPNLFYGTGIPACIIVIDKEGAKNRSGIFMIDASKGYIKEGSKNRLREQDIYRIVTTFNEKITTDPKYARFVLNKEIKGKNEYNLNISRYIDSSDSEDIQDIYAHIHGGIPIADIDALEHFWKVFPSLKDELFDVFSEGYYKLNVEEDVIRQTIYSNEEFIAYGEKIDEHTMGISEFKKISPCISCSYGEDRFKKAIKFGWGRRPYNKYCVIMDNWIHRHEEGIAYRRMEYVNEVLNRYGLKWFSNKHNEIMLKYGIFPQKLVGYYLLDRNLDNKINKYVINKHYVDKWEEDEEFEIGQSLYFDQKIDFEKLGMYNTIYQYDGQAFTIAGRRN